METTKYPGCHPLLIKELNLREQTSLSKNFINSLSRVLVCKPLKIQFFRADLYLDFPTEPDFTEPSFELPRRQGVNDSYETYISQVCKDPNTQRTIIEEILNSYGSQPSKDISLASLTQGRFQIELKYSCVISNLREQETRRTFISVHNSSSNRQPLN
jgi:hypothetical protein